MLFSHSSSFQVPSFFQQTNQDHSNQAQQPSSQVDQPTNVDKEKVDVESNIQNQQPRVDYRIEASKPAPCCSFRRIGNILAIYMLITTVGRAYVIMNTPEEGAYAKQGDEDIYDFWARLVGFHSATLIVSACWHHLISKYCLKIYPIHELFGEFSRQRYSFPIKSTKNVIYYFLSSIFIFNWGITIMYIVIFLGSKHANGELENDDIVFESFLFDVGYLLIGYSYPSLFITYDLTIKPCSLIDWVKLVIVDLFTNWFDILMSFLLSAVILIPILDLLFVVMLGPLLFCSTSGIKLIHPYIKPLKRFLVHFTHPNIAGVVLYQFVRNVDEICRRCQEDGCSCCCNRSKYEERLRAERFF